MIALNGITDCSDLSSTQEEADTRIVLHALNADRLYRENKVKGRIVVKSPDIDILVLLIHYFPQMTSTCEVWFQTGMVTSIKDCRHHIPLHELCKSLNSFVCNILPAAHATVNWEILVMVLFWPILAPKYEVPKLNTPKYVTLQKLTTKIEHCLKIFFYIYIH